MTWRRTFDLILWLVRACGTGAAHIRPVTIANNQREEISCAYSCRSLLTIQSEYASGPWFQVLLIIRRFPTNHDREKWGHEHRSRESFKTVPRRTNGTQQDNRPGSIGPDHNDDRARGNAALTARNVFGILTTAHSASQFVFGRQRTAFWGQHT